MAIDTSIYGDVTDWNIYSNGGNPDPDLQVYCLSDYLSQNATTPIGEPIDKSLACSGLGQESCFSKIKWYYTGDLATVGEGGGGDVNPTFTDLRGVTSWCFGDTHRPYSGSQTEYGQDGSVIIDGDTVVSGTYPDLCRYAPEPASEPFAPTSWYNRSNIKPITQFAHKNLVALIYVDVSNTMGLYAELHTMTLKEYLDTYTTTYPYIYGVSFRLYIDNYNLSTIQRTGLGSINTCAVAMLDRVNLPKIKSYFYNLVSFTGYYIKLMGGFPAQGGRFTVQGSTSATNKTYIGACIPDTWKMHIIDGTEINQRSRGYVYREYSDTFEKECYVQMACFGLLFTADSQTALSGAIDDELMMCGVLDENLIGHGIYTSGTDNTENEQLLWNNSNDSNYDPSYEPRIDPNVYGISSSFNAVSLADGALKRYALNVADMEALGEALWDIIDTTDPDALIQNQTLTNFLTNNPLDCIVGIKKFALPDMGQSGTTNIRLGKINVPNTSAQAFYSDSTTMSCGSKYVFPIFYDWRDYLCEYTLVLPFCGTVSLPPEIVVGKWIEVKYSIDYTTGTCTAWVLSELDDGSDVVIDSASGNCSIDIPISGIQTADLTSNIYNANENLKALKFNNMIDGVKGSMSFVSAVSSGDKMAAMSSGLNLGSDIVNSIHNQVVGEWNINNTIIPLKMIGASSGCNSFQHELTPRLIIYYPVKGHIDEKAYAHTVGYQCCETSLISSYTGYAEISNVELSEFAATAAEKEMIKSLLASGVFL